MDKEKNLMENNILNKYYNSIIRFRVAKPYVTDINLLYDVINNFSSNIAENVLKRIVFKYRKQVNEIGKHLTGIMALNNTAIYREKTEEDLFFELHYMLRCIIIFAAVKIGLEKNIFEAVKKVKEENLNLRALNIFE